VKHLVLLHAAKLNCRAEYSGQG